MILTILTCLNLIICSKIFHIDMGSLLFMKFLKFNIILMISYYQITLSKKIIEKFTDIEFLNCNEQHMAVSY